MNRSRRDLAERRPQRAPHRRVRVLAALLAPLAAACTMQVEPLPLPPAFHAMESAVDEGERSTGYLGLEVALNESDDLMSLDLQPGVRVVAVEPGGPAEEAGVRVGDVLLEFDGTSVDDPQRLVALLAEVAEPRTAVLTLQRGTRVLEAEAGLAVRVARGVRLLYHVDRALLRVALEDGPRGLPVVVALAPGSPLLEAGVAEGERITAFEGRDPGSAAGFLQRVRANLEPGDPFTLEVEGKDGSRRTVEAEAWHPGSRLTALGLWPLFRWERGLVDDARHFWVLDLILVFGYSRKSGGGETETSVLGLLEWRSGTPELEEVRP